MNIPPQHQLNLTPKAQTQIARLLEKTEHKDITELIKHSLRMYDSLTEFVTKGGSVILKHPSGKQVKLDLLDLSTSPVDY